MRIRVGVGLAAGILLCLAALSASATGNAWGTHLGEMKSTATASSSVGNGNGHAWGLMLADMKGKGREREDAEDQGENDDDQGGGGHVLASLLDEHSKGDHSGLRSPEQADDNDDQGGGDQGNTGPTSPGVGTGGQTGGVGGVPSGPAPSEVAAAPEPSAALLFAAGTGLVALRLRRPRP